jgi:hypothetical protein
VTKEEEVTGKNQIRSFIKKKNKYIYIYIYTSKGKDKAVPLQAWGGPQGSRKLRFPDFLTTAEDGGKFISLKHRSHLLPGNIIAAFCEGLESTEPLSVMSTRGISWG